MPTREETIVKNLKPFVQPKQHIVEIGAGNGIVAQMLHDATGADFTLLDVVDYNASKLPMQLYDGRSLPFPDNSFDLAMLVFVLHHNPDPRPVMWEAMRVARSGVLVVENDTRGLLKKPLTRLIDSTEYLHRGVPRCYMTKSSDEWRAFFEALPARATELHRFDIGWYWKNVIMRVEKQG
ncbi:MAG: methyltransferase domain-containing protein [Anaerolineae bacterium]|nr:methyltransferase domain-containing protein [Anaerolineae bacterium]